MPNAPAARELERTQIIGRVALVFLAFSSVLGAGLSSASI